MSKVRRFFRRTGLIGAMCLPNILKKPFYRLCFGYKIARGVRIGFSYIDCQRLEIGEDCRIRHGVAFLECGEVKLGKKVRIGPLNIFRGGLSITLDDYSELLRMNVINAIPHLHREQTGHAEFYLGRGSIITSEHKIDFTDRVTIGKHSILGGRNSSLWSHNRGDGGEIRIGDYCYIGSEIRMAPGASIPDLSIVGLGSVVIGSNFEPYTLIAGNPASARRKLSAKDHHLIFDVTRGDLPAEDRPAIPTDVGRSAKVSAAEADIFERGERASSSS